MRSRTVLLYAVLSVLLIAVHAPFLFAQELPKSKKELRKEKKAAEKSKGPQKGKVYFSPLPAIAANPTFGVMYGVAASTSVFMG